MGRLVKITVLLARALLFVVSVVAFGAGLALAIATLGRRRHQAPPVAGSWRELRPPAFD